MSGLRPVSLYGLEVPPGDEPVPAFSPGEYPGTFRLTMAALNPFEKPIANETANSEASFMGATLTIIRVPDDDSDDEDDSDEEDLHMAELLDGISSEDDEDEDVNGGPSDPEKSNKAKRMALLKEALEQNGEMELDSPKLSAKAKGKAKAVGVGEEDEDDLDDEDEDDEDDFDGPEEFVLCTLDPSKNYQQTLDITVSEHETVYFQVSGTHTIYLTGNILVPDEGELDTDEEDDDSEDEDEYDLTPDDDELEMPDSEDESDDLDDMEDPRILELDDEEEEPPKLIKIEPAVTKGKNKRTAPDSEDNSMVDEKPATLDDLIAKSLKPADEAAPNGEKLSKKQKKKLKANGGNAVEAPAVKEEVGKKTEDTIKPSPGKADKKVQFSKTLIQGPTPSGTTSDSSKAKTAEAPKAADTKPVNGGTGTKVVQGVTIDDKKLGSGPAAKKGDKVGMRYIGKLENKKVFDANKKGKPFTFQLGAGQVIKGWDIGIQGMTVGGERRLTIPAHLAYGSKALPDIPANSTLIFDVKLLEIK